MAKRPNQIVFTKKENRGSRRLERLAELNARDQRIIVQILDGFLPRGEETPETTTS